ncbi:MAG TPA: UDP-2,3-diacylglucosamine diphosphatase [Acidiferrobacteraceae bacterium]|nr:UDP-2,3-diacylglucosamine diphosphatase [Acidiferrobacteraceae bacterium]
MPTLFISDLHLSASRPQIIDLFLRFLQGPARDADQLYILGDLFDYWVGDEMLQSDDHANLGAALRRLTDSGVSLYIAHGNRDFLLGQNFTQTTGSTLLEETTVIDLYGTPALIMHGDSLCIGDVEHQAWRRQVLSSQWQQEFLAQSLDKRIDIAKSLRQQSEENKQHKAIEIMDASQQAIEDTMRQHKVKLLIHGHTHRPGRHRFELDGEPVRRIVLGDWYQQGSVLVCTNDDWELIELGLLD